MIIQKAPRRSLCRSIEALSSFGTKDDIKIYYLCITGGYSSPAEDYASQVNIHALRKIHASRVNINASRKIHPS